MEISKGITKAEVIKAVRKTLQYRTAARDKFKMGYLDMDEFDWEMAGKPYPIALLTKEEVEVIMGFKTLNTNTKD